MEEARIAEDEAAVYRRKRAKLCKMVYRECSWLLNFTAAQPHGVQRPVPQWLRPRAPAVPRDVTMPLGLASREPEVIEGKAEKLAPRKLATSNQPRRFMFGALANSKHVGMHPEALTIDVPEVPAQFAALEVDAAAEERKASQPSHEWQYSGSFVVGYNLNGPYVQQMVNVVI